MNLLRELIGIQETEKPLKFRVAEALRAAGVSIPEKQLLEGKSIGELEHLDNGTCIRIFDDMENPFVAKIAKAIGVHDGGNLKRVANDFYAVYNHGHDLTFYSDPNDYQED